MKYFGVSILIVAILIQVLSASLIVFNYELNISYIIENFCENTDRPELKCNGKCHLNKQIKKDAKQKSEIPATLSELMPLVLITQEISTFQFEAADAIPLKFNSLYLEGKYSNSLQSVFHPPQI